MLLVVGVSILQRGDLGIGDRPSPAATVEPTLDPSATPGPISIAGQIAFERTVDGNTDLYLMNLDRTGLVRLTDDEGNDRQPTWTPDGRTLLFSRRSVDDVDESDLYTIEIERETEVRLTVYAGGESEPRVSPDGARVIFESYPMDPGIYVMDIDGSNRRLLFTPPDDTYFPVDWSADGASFYLSRYGTEILRLDVATGVIAPVVAGGDETMSLSPDGTTFAFQSDGLAPGGLFLMNADGSNVRHLVGTWSDGGRISWASDGHHLAFALSDGWLYIVGVDGTGLTRWTDQIGGFAWRPD